MKVLFLLALIYSCSSTTDKEMTPEDYYASHLKSQKKAFNDVALTQYKTYVNGKENSGAIRTALEQNLNKFGTCYAKKEQFNPKATKAKAKLKFNISDHGYVRKAFVDSKMQANVQNCMLGVLQNIKFPKSNPNTLVNVTQEIKITPKM